MLDDGSQTMPAFARTGTGKWHIIGPDGCRYGKQFDEEEVPEETEHATDIIAYEPSTQDDVLGSDSSPPSVSVSFSMGGSTFPHGRTDSQKLVLPATVSDSSGLCGSCRTTLERHQKRRARVIAGLKLVTPLRDPDWQTDKHDSRQRCDWCRAREIETSRSGALGCRVCPACAHLYGSGFGEPDEEHVPDRDRLPETPAGTVDPIVFGTSLSGYDPSVQTGSNRPLLKYREKDKYAEIVCELERTGHGFSAEGLDALEHVCDEYAERVATDESHQTKVTCSVGRTPRTVTIEGLLPADRESVLEDCWAIVSDPENWIPLGWPSNGYLYRREGTPSIPGDDSVVEEFPRLQRLATADSDKGRASDETVKREKLQSVTESGRYERGERYYQRGAVSEIELIDERIEATVQGSRPYDVQVRLSDGKFETGRCSCPDDAMPCKHIVAAILESEDLTATYTDESLDELLDGASADELRALLSDLAEEDISVRKRIYESFAAE